MTDFRIVFSKTGPLIYISHLDLTHTFVRAFKRAHLPLRYSEGFNPHPKLAFALPLSVGMTGHNEICDVGLSKDISLDFFTLHLTEVMPPHLTIKSVDVPTKKLREVKGADYSIDFIGEADKIPAIEEFLHRPEIRVIRTTKSGEKEQDIRPRIFKYQLTEKNGAAHLRALIDASADGYLNPEYVIKALKEEGIVEAADFSIARNKILF